MIEINIIGTLVDPGAYDADENEISPPVTHAGFHVNILSEGLTTRPDLAPFVVTPDRLRRVFMGREDDTVALRFADESEAQDALGLSLPDPEDT